MITVTVLLVLIYWFVEAIALHLLRRKIKRKNGCRPLRYRHNYRGAILGLDWVLLRVRAFRGKRFLEFMTKQFEDLGPTYGVKILGQTTIYTMDPKNIQAILSDRFKDFALGNRLAIMEKLLGKGIFTADGNGWVHSRSMLRPIFASNQAGNLDMLENHLQNLFKLIPRDGSTVDLQPLMSRFALDSVTEFLFDQSVNTLRNGKQIDQQFNESFDYALKELAFRFRLGPFYKFRWNWNADEAFRKCRLFVGRLVNEAQWFYYANAKSSEQPSGRKHLFLRGLVDAADDQDRITDEALNLLIAGRDTTASVLSHLFFEISRNPGVWQSLRNEVSRLQGRRPTYKQLRGLKFVHCCVKETLRLHPPVPTNKRFCVNDTVLPLGGGRHGKRPIFVPKGTTVVFTVHAMHRRKDLFGADAEEFRPQRWDQETLHHGWSYLPFHAGPRVCLGLSYAMNELCYVLIRMLQEFNTIESRDDQPWTESLRLIVASNSGVKVGARAALSTNL
ncbi:MAG: hypothetical protein Q9167_003315 [Letrouitia subvulpina]